MKILLKIIAIPFIIVLSVLVVFPYFIFCISEWICTAVAILFAGAGIIMLATGYSVETYPPAIDIPPSYSGEGFQGYFSILGIMTGQQKQITFMGIFWHNSSFTPVRRSPYYHIFSLFPDYPFLLPGYITAADNFLPRFPSYQVK
ncbi:MAG: hypothetical protein GX799_08265 [Crenarchaeota archaeon]|jgi:hypothetical protein|nr:hypothetical protein [Thermoproteota archaeon]